MAHLLSADRVSLEYPTRSVLSEVSCGVNDGDRIGIVGRNGDGKTSLLAILAGTLTPTSGQVTLRRGLRVGVLPQEDVLVASTSTVGRVVVQDNPVHEWASDARIRQILSALIPGVPFDSRVSQLSGGERRRVALASLLIGDWDVLALDEPSNHLDMAAISWLAAHLRARWSTNKGGLLLVTHDRWLLDEVSTSTWEVHDETVDSFVGGYASYVLARVERDRTQAAAETKRRNLMRKELAWLRRGAPARTAKPRFRVEAANVLIKDVPPIRDTVTLERLSMTRLGKKVVDLEDVSFSFPTSSSGSDQSASPILSHITWKIAPGERTGILGGNGVGKTTLLKLVAGDLDPTSGTVTRGKTVNIAVLDQGYSHLSEFLMNRVSDVLARLKNEFIVEEKPVSPTQLLERLGCGHESLAARVGELSGGQRRRLQVLLALCQEPNVLILDEPTNDVDTDMLNAMEDLLDSWQGTLIVVSHDRYFVERVTDQQFALIGGKLRHLPSGVDEYMRIVSCEPKRSHIGHRSERKTATDSSRGRSLRRELSSLESRLSRAATEIVALNKQLDTTPPSDWEKLTRLSDGIRRATQAKEELESRWLETAEEIERLLT